MIEDYYTVLMRKVLLRTSCEVEEKILFNWLQHDEGRLKTFSMVSIMLSLEEPELWECFDNLPDDPENLPKKQFLYSLKSALDDLSRHP